MCSVSNNDLTNHGNDFEGLQELALAVAACGSLAELNLSANQLCGVDWRGGGTYTPQTASRPSPAL